MPNLIEFTENILNSLPESHGTTLLQTNSLNQMPNHDVEPTMSTPSPHSTVFRAIVVQSPLLPTEDIHLSLDQENMWPAVTYTQEQQQHLQQYLEHEEYERAVVRSLRDLHGF